MFYGWVALMKDKKKDSLALKFKVPFFNNLVFQTVEKNLCHQKTQYSQWNARLKQDQNQPHQPQVCVFCRAQTITVNAPFILGIPLRIKGSPVNTKRSHLCLASLRKILKRDKSSISRLIRKLPCIRFNSISRERQSKHSKSGERNTNEFTPSKKSTQFSTSTYKNLSTTHFPASKSADSKNSKSQSRTKSPVVTTVTII